MESKSCKGCGIEKTVDQFSVQKACKLGVSSRCKHCKSSYYQANRDRFLEKRKTYVSENKELIASQYVDQRKKCFFKYRRKSLKFRGGSDCATVAEISRLWKSQRGICTLTGRRLNRSNAHLDHIIPLTKGGTSDAGNLRWIHKRANYAKHNMLDPEFIQLCKEIAVFSSLNSDRNL